MNWEDLSKYFHNHGRRLGQHHSSKSFKNDESANNDLMTKTTSKNKKIDLLIKDLLNKTNKSLNKSNKFQNIKRFFSFNSKEDIMKNVHDSNGKEYEQECKKAATICSVKSTSSSFSNTSTISTASTSSISNSNESLDQLNNSKSTKSTVYYSNSQPYRSSPSYLSASSSSSSTSSSAATNQRSRICR